MWKLAITLPESFVSGEAVVLQIILRNLAENAVRHTESTLEMAVVEQGDGRLRYSISDNGPGFPGGVVRFDEIMRLRHTTQDNRGFGLAAVAHLVESRGGKTWIEATAPGAGTTICFDLPGRIVWETEADIAPPARIASK